MEKVQRGEAANDPVRSLWPAEAQVYVLQAKRLISLVEEALAKQSPSVRMVPEEINNIIRRLRKAQRIVTKGLR